MGRLALAALVVSLALALGGCGDEHAHEHDEALEGTLSYDPNEPPPFFPRGLPLDEDDPANPLSGTGAGAIELTDEVMADYLEVLEELRDLDTNKPGAALLAAHDLDWPRWAFISATILRSTVTTNVPERIETAEKVLAQLREQAAQATNERTKAVLAGQIQSVERQLLILRKNESPSELDQRNFAVVQRWLKKLEEAGK